MHIRCSHCHSPIELVDDVALTDLSCPSCGSQFNLISGDTTGTYHVAQQTLGHFELLQQVCMGHFGTVWQAAIRRSVHRGSPYGDALWSQRAVRRLGLHSTLRPPGRPKKAKNGS